MPSAPAVSSLQAANPAIGTVARAPQTTVAPVAPGAPFSRQSEKAQQLGFAVSGVPFGGTVTQQLSAVGGYLRALSVTVTASGGSGTTTAAVMAADAPWNVLGTVQFRDPTGQPLYQLDSFSLYLVNLASGQVGQSGRQNPSSWPSYVAPNTGGNFTLRLIVPLELDSSGYCSLADMNAAAQPLLNLSLASAAQVFSTQPAPTLPTLAIQVNELFWTIPQANPTIAPPDVGSSAQWNVVNGGQNPTTGANLRVQHPSPGTWIHTLILVLRDATNARINAFPATDLTLWVDNVPVVNAELLTERQDALFRQFGIPFAVADQGTAAGNVKTAGVIVYTRRTAVQDEVSAADTHDLLLRTTPATKLEVGGTWGTITNSPAQLQFVTGWLYPANSDGIPYTHLAS